MTFVGDVLSSQYELVPAEVHLIPLACRGFVRIPLGTPIELVAGNVRDVTNGRGRRPT